MSKLKAILNAAKGTLSTVGLIGTVTGHGLVFVAASALNIRLQPQHLRILAKYQYESAEKAFKEAGDEWNKA